MVQQVKDTLSVDQFKPFMNMEELLGFLYSRNFRPSVIMDVGAHLSVWSRTAKKFFNDSVFYLIEPLVEMKEKLEEFCNENPGSKYFLNGVGSENETVYLIVYENNLAGSSMIKNKLPNLRNLFEQREIPLLTIDSLIAENNLQIPDMIKLDVQGFELEALKGAASLFGKTEVFILEACLYEVTPGAPIFSDVIKFMKERGYDLFDLTGYFRQISDLSLIAVDLCFAKSNGMLRTS